MFEIKTINWNSVVVGKWNPAILSPKGIAEEIFHKKDDHPIEVMIPLDAIGPPKIRNEGLFVSADFERLVIDCEKSDWESLDKSRKYCCHAIDALPKTPISAAGYNVRYEIKDPPYEFIELFDKSLDDKISDNYLIISRREIRRSIKWKEGTINLHIIKPESLDYQVMLNFDRKSVDNSNLLDWLKIPIEAVKEATQTIFCSVLQICEEDKI